MSCAITRAELVTSSDSHDVEQPPRPSISPSLIKRFDQRVGVAQHEVADVELDVELVVVDEVHHAERHVRELIPAGGERWSRKLHWPVAAR